MRAVWWKASHLNTSNLRRNLHLIILLCQKKKKISIDSLFPWRIKEAVNNNFENSVDRTVTIPACYWYSARGLEEKAKQKDTELVNV